MITLILQKKHIGKLVGCDTTVIQTHGLLFDIPKNRCLLSHKIAMKYPI